MNSSDIKTSEGITWWLEVLDANGKVISSCHDWQNEKEAEEFGRKLAALPSWDGTARTFKVRSKKWAVTCGQELDASLVAELGLEP